MAPTPKSQEQKEKDAEKKKFSKQSKELSNLVQQIRCHPAIWKLGQLQFLRVFIDHVMSHRDEYPRQPGYVSAEENQDDGGMHAGTPLTAGFAAKVADSSSSCDIENPVVQVISKEVKQTKGHGPNSNFKLVQLRVVDGDGNQMAVRLDTNAANHHRGIDAGSVIMLSVYTACSAKVNDESVMRPMVLLLSFVKLGHRPPPDSSALKSPLEMTNDAGAASDGHDDSDIPIDLENADCNENSRLCSLYGVGFDKCICQSIRPEDLSENIQEIAEDCHFVTKDVASFTNSDKRFVLCWYYATNVYCICGKGKRKPLPACLVRAIRNLHPEADGKYTGFKEVEYTETNELSGKRKRK